MLHPNGSTYKGSDSIWLTVIKEAVGLNLSENIAEGSQVSATSKKLELKLTQVTRASLEELRLVYEDLIQKSYSNET